MMSGFILSGVFLFLGLAIHKFKWYFLISGYNTMSKEKKANVNVAGLGKLMGLFGYFNAVLFFVMGCFEWLDIDVPQSPFWVLFAVVTVAVLIKAQKYDGNLFDEQGKWRKGAWKQLVVPGIILGVVAIAVAVLLYASVQPVEVKVRKDAFEINDLYGDEYTWESITKIQLIEQLPTIKYRANGSAVGSNLRGYFNTEQLGTIKLLVNTEVPLFILVESNGKIVIINLETEARTLKLYEEMTSRWQ